MSNIVELYKDVVIILICKIFNNYLKIVTFIQIPKCQKIPKYEDFCKITIEKTEKQFYNDIYRKGGPY